MISALLLDLHILLVSKIECVIVITDLAIDMPLDAPLLLLLLSKHSSGLVARITLRILKAFAAVSDYVKLEHCDQDSQEQVSDCITLLLVFAVNNH